MRNKSYTNYRKSYKGLEEKESEPQIEEAVTEIQEEPIVVKDAKEERQEPGAVGNCVCVNVRSEPKPDSVVQDILPVGTNVSILLSKSTETFYCVSYNHSPDIKTGYINKDFVIRGQGHE